MRGTDAQPVAAPREVHLRLEVVSQEFEGQSLIKRQRRIYQVHLETDPYVRAYKQHLVGS